MNVYIVDKNGKLLENQNLTPKCENKHPGEGDFCDRCGDCLHCHDEDTCPHSKDGRHMWVIEEDLYCSPLRT